MRSRKIGSGWSLRFALGIALWAAGGGSVPLLAATAVQESDEPCTCAELLDALVAKVEADYPGYRLEVLGTPREALYRRHVEAMRRGGATTAAGLDCVALLQAYVAWFEDGHLFVGGRPPVATAEDSARLREAAPRVTWAEADVVRYLDGGGDALDPVEGIWVDPAGLRLAVLREGWDGANRDASQAPARFTAAVLASSAEQWKAGDVKAELERLPDGSYDVVLYDDARAATRPHVYTRGLSGGGRLQRGGLLLHMPPTTWGKLHPVRPEQEGRIDPRDPRAPTARMVGDQTVVFHVPSNVPSHTARLHLLVDQYRGALSRAENLIIDLRGNEGGSSTMTGVLMPFLVTPDKRPARYLAEGESAVLASADNIAYFERMSWAPPGLVARLRAAEPGTLVPFADPAPEAAGPAARSAAPEAHDVALEHPRNVAILTDAMTVSAAEAFVLQAMRNGKVTSFGQPTGGSIDYQTVGIVRFGCRSAGLYVGYPTIIGSDRLPEGGVRPTGIVPDVALDPADPEPILRIVEYYRQRRSQGRTERRERR